MIKGTTKNLGVMGWPIAHSLSPVLQNAAIEKAGLDYVYISLPRLFDGVDGAGCLRAQRKARQHTRRDRRR